MVAVIVAFLIGSAVWERGPAGGCLMAMLLFAVIGFAATVFVVLSATF